MQKSKRKVSYGWWAVRFRMNWHDNTSPLFHIDTLIAHRILLPVLDKYRKGLSLWRFHPRATRDKEGHKFSFIFYTTKEKARNIFRSIQADRFLKRMKREKIIKEDLYDDTTKPKKHHIEDTSDRHWSEPIRRSWPYFIMGVCQMWIELIEEIAKKELDSKRRINFSKIPDVYKKINNTINQTWRDEGGHSLLHHLNAIFGYESVLIHEFTLKRF